MPELPEVENIRLQLQKFLVGHTFENVEVGNEKSFQGEPEAVIGGQVEEVRRFGKLLIIDLDNDYSLAIHVKMTGQLIYRGPNLKRDVELSDKVKDGLGGKYTHVVFELNEDGNLYFNDVRKFGWIKVVRTDEVEDMDFVDKLGPEPLDGLTLEKFKEICNSTSRAIKTLLMDQSKIGGVGNIYANDALFIAKIHPKAKANKIPEEKITMLYEAIEEVLKKGLEYGGSSQNSFVKPDGTAGEYQEHFIVYGKDGEPCPNGCGATLDKTKVSGRGTFFCPNCQKPY